jgi:predicted MFS family arabinose efflux permease
VRSSPPASGFFGPARWTIDPARVIRGGIVSLTLLYFVTFLESIGTGILQRGIYFYTHERLGFGQLANLLVALAYGAVYVGGALKSHAAATKWGERNMMTATLVALFVVHVALALSPSPALLCAGFVLSAGLRGLGWPLFESYVSAGRTPSEILTAVGGYNVSWACAMPIAVGITGPLISSDWPFLIFALPAAINLVAFALVLRLPAHPKHLDHAHPERPAEDELARIGKLLGSARWSMLAGYGLLFLLAPLMPAIFQRLRLDVAMATPAAALFDVVRVTSFVVLGRTGGVWRGRATPLAVTAILLPVGFLMVLFGSGLATVLAGEVIFGAASGFAYTAALSYAMVVENASVDAGGTHEGLIGLGLGLGPLAGIAGYLLAGQRFVVMGGEIGSLQGTLVAVSPLLMACVAGALRPMPRLLRAP